MPTRPVTNMLHVALQAALSAHPGRFRVGQLNNADLPLRVVDR